ncbi:hypothetical protein ACTQ2W_04110 [Ligilactobacillus ruminis]|uniref:hypothetical protein n=1 Tax=Ligilactobacillus ruminis TaxID=1623 RepID=UPI002361E6EB|nr:hypothetical protein [Ligilactobacillus ruminis]MDD5959013.1 hypothetical protein [Ligilactobacillus ruminis]WDC79679.1 hypothetical protein PSR47_07855 [Ligilactobacillus ruminis]
MKKSHVSLWEWVPNNAIDLRLVLSGIFSILRHGNLFFSDVDYLLKLYVKTALRAKAVL